MRIFLGTGSTQLNPISVIGIKTSICSLVGNGNGDRKLCSAHDRKKIDSFSFEKMIKTEGDFPFLVEAIADTITVGKIRKQNTEQLSK